MSKAAAWSLTNGSRGELRAQGTHVIGSHVGFMDTEMASRATGPKAAPDDGSGECGGRRAHAIRYGSCVSGQIETAESTGTKAVDAAEADALIITVPSWVNELASAAEASGPLDTDEARMGFVVALSRRNVDEGGGPFAAAVFAGARLLAAGVNRVLDSGFSIAHGEIVALMRAQQAARHALKPSQSGPYTLVTSTEPCCQCFGALIWSGVTRMVCGATTADAESIGFDEGPKPDRWPEVLAARGISVTFGVCRDEAKQVLETYAQRGGPIYGLRHPTIT